jgi:hypothetical protein
MPVIIFAISIVAALFATQLPEYLQQYAQRLGGAADELARIVGHFDDDSRRSGYQRAEALKIMKSNPERLFKEQAARMEDHISRLERINEQQQALRSGVSVSSAFAVLLNYDPVIAQKTYDNFSPALPFTFTSLAFGSIGFLFSLVTLTIVGWLLRQASRSTASA